MNQDVINTSILERFSNDCRKTKIKAITPTNHNRSRQRDEPITITCNSLKAREKSRVHGANSFDFASRWWKTWRKSFKPITKRSNRNHVITFDSHLKIALNACCSYLTTALLNWGWVPQTSRSFQYWHQAPRWDYSHGWKILATQPWAPTQKAPDALAQVPYQTQLGMKECWHSRTHWCVCITILQTLKGTQTLIVNSVKLHLTALKEISALAVLHCW